MKQLLFIRYRRPGGIAEGGEQVTDTNYRLLGRLLGEANITAYPVHDRLGTGRILRQAPAIALRFLQGYYYGLSPRRVREIVALARGHAAVFIDRSLFAVVAKALKESDYPGKIVTFFHNVEPVYFAAKIGPGRPWRPVVVRCADRNDAWACRYSDVTIALNRRDADELERRYGRRPDLITPVVFRDRYVRDTYPDARTGNVPVCLFLGTYLPMNVHGITWFIRKVLPEVDIRLQIVGKGMKAMEKQVAGRPDIELFSDVPDLTPFIEQADFMLLPLFRGSGMKIKTCESLMYGKNILGTTEAFQGYELDYDRVGARCDTREAFIEALRRFSAHPVGRFNPYARQVFLEKYAEEVRLEQFRRIWAE